MYGAEKSINTQTCADVFIKRWMSRSGYFGSGPICHLILGIISQYFCSPFKESTNLMKRLRIIFKTHPASPKHFLGHMDLEGGLSLGLWLRLR